VIKAIACSTLISWMSIFGAVAALADGSSLKVPINPQQLENAFFLPNGHQKFESTVWKRSPEHRFAMLFELYQMNLIGRTEQEIHELLGPAQRVTKNNRGLIDQHEYFDLGTKKGSQLNLDFCYQGGRLSSFRINQHCQSDYQSVVQGDWQTTNPESRDIAENLNKYYFLVGAPVDQLRNHWELPALREYSSWLDGCPFRALAALFSFRAAPINPGALHGKCSNQFELECTLQNSKIKRFRLVHQSACILGTSTYGEWQETDLRPDPRCFLTDASYSHLYGLNALLVTPNMEFEGSAWQTWGGALRMRKDMLCDLIHSRRLIGMSRSEACRLLGPPDQIQRQSTSLNQNYSSPMESDRSDDLTKDCDWYSLTYSGCGNAPTTYFEIAYQGDRIKAFRVSTRNDCDPDWGNPDPERRGAYFGNFFSSY
jgi:hypothetical protein